MNNPLLPVRRILLTILCFLRLVAQTRYCEALMVCCWEQESTLHGRDFDSPTGNYTSNAEDTGISNVLAMSSTLRPRRNVCNV
ncbi:hypothetical protein BJX65DRAFT_261489 [Aspergillus insuetus]